MLFGKIDKYLILGGGDLFEKICIHLRREEKDFLSVTSPRHAKECGILIKYLDDAKNKRVFYYPNKRKKIERVKKVKVLCHHYKKY